MVPIIKFFLQLVAMERFLVELMTINKKVSMIKWGDPLCRFFTQPQTCRLSRFFGLLQLDRLQLTVVCCNRRGCEHHTSHRPISTVILHACTRMAQVWSALTHPIYAHVSCALCVSLFASTSPFTSPSSSSP